MGYQHSHRDAKNTLGIVLEARKKEYLELLKQINDVYDQFLHRAIAECEYNEKSPLYCVECGKTTDYRIVVPIRERPIKYFGYAGPDFNVCVYCENRYSTQDEWFPGTRWRFVQCHFCGAPYYERHDIMTIHDAGFPIDRWCSKECYGSDGQWEMLKMKFSEYKDELFKYNARSQQKEIENEREKSASGVSASEDQQPIELNGRVH